MAPDHLLFLLPQRATLFWSVASVDLPQGWHACGQLRRCCDIPYTGGVS